jgi:quinol monooxygenase YgiN
VFARTTTIDAATGTIDAGIAFMRDEAFPTVTAMPGCVGMSVVADRESGRCIATSAWESQEALRASENDVRPLRERGREIFGNPATVDEWELAVVHRDHPSGDGAACRSTWIQGKPEDIDNAIDVFRMTTLPGLAEIEGFASASLMVNRSDGRALATIAYDNRDMLERSRQQADALRTRTVTETGSDVRDVREFDLLMAHLHVPEMA